MSGNDAKPVAAVDVGNSRVKIAVYSRQAIAATPPRTLPTPAEACDFDPRTGDAGPLEALLAGCSAREYEWWVASVQRDTSQRLVERIRDAGAEQIRLVTSFDVSLRIKVPRPDMVGIDRLLGAAAADRLREPQRPAVVVSVGSAITVNLVTAAGEFVGGAILPGIGMSARALHEFTDLLPLVDMHSLKETPPTVGDATISAMTSGLFWGAVGGIRQLIELFARDVGGEPQVFLTGGAAPSVAKLLPGDARYERHLVTAGIALAASRPAAT